jgi:thioredoxin 1
MAEKVRELTDADFADAVRDGVALVDFHGTYCPPCKLLDPVIESLAERWSGRALVAKVNVDDCFEAAVNNSVEDIPTIVFFKNGEERNRLFGLQTVETLEEELGKLLA